MLYISIFICYCLNVFPSLSFSLFEKNEGAIKFFKGLDSANTSVSDLRDNKMLQNHVKGVMLTIDEAITSMDELDSTINLLMHVGRSHIRFMHFDPNVFLVSIPLLS